MNLTPDKTDAIGIKISKFEKVQKTTTQVRTLQTDRKAKQNIKSPLMLILLLKKKIKTRLQQSFLKLNLYRNKGNIHKIVTKYISSILKFKIKYNQTFTLQRLKNNGRRFKFIRKSLNSLSALFYNKLKYYKTLSFSRMQIIQKKVEQKVQKTEQLKTEGSNNLMKDSKVASTTRKNQMNRSLDVGNKMSASASRLNVFKRLQFQKQQEIPLDIAKIKKQNEQLKLMELSEQAREALKKVQRFDRVIYAQEAQKVCKQVLANELRRLQKIKNVTKQMRVQYYDNQLTITALYNHVKLISQINRDLGDLNKFKQIYQKQQSKKKQEQFRINLQNKRNKNKGNNETLVKQSIDNIQAALSKKDYNKAKQQISLIINKYQKDQLLKDRIVIYKALLQNISYSKQSQKNVEDLLKILQSFKNIDLYKQQDANKLLKSIQKQLTQAINRYSLKQQQSSIKTLNSFKQFEYIANHLMDYLQKKPGRESQQQSPSPVKSTSKGVLPKKSSVIDQINKKQMTHLQQIKKQYQQINKLKNQFEKRVKVISEKAKNKLDFTRQVQHLLNDQLFANQKPFNQFFNLLQLSKDQQQKKNQIKMNALNNLIIQLNQFFNRDQKQKTKLQIKTKQQSKLFQSFIKKNPEILEIAKNIESLLSVVSKTSQSSEEPAPKRLKTQQLSVQKDQGLNKSKSRLDQIQQSKKDDKNKKSELESNQKIAQLTTNLQKQKQSRTKLQKQISSMVESNKVFQTIQKKIQDIVQKIKKNQQWLPQFQLLKKDKTITSHKNLQMLFKFYQVSADTIKKSKLNSSKIQKLLVSTNKVIQKKNLALDKKISEVQRLFDQAQKLDPNLEEIYKIVLQWIKTCINLFNNEQKEIERLYQLQNKKLIDSIENQKNKSKQLNEKVKSLQKISKQKETQLNRNQSSKKLPIQNNKSAQLTKVDNNNTKTLQNQLKISKQRIQALQKQINEFKNGQKKQKSIGKQLKVSEPKNLQGQIKRLKQQLQVYKQKQVKQKTDKSKQQQVLTQTNKSLTSITTILTNKTYKQLQAEANKLLKIYEKDQKIIGLINLISSLIKLVIQKQQIQVAKTKETNTISHKFTEVVRNIQIEANKKEFLKNDECWDNMLAGLQTQDKGILNLFKTVKRMSEICRTKLTEERKSIQKSIKSYENQLQKINKVINQYQIKIKQKDKQYQQLYQTYAKTQKQTDDKKRSNSLKSSRKSMRQQSANKGKQQMRNLKTSMQALAEQQKNMLQKLNKSQNQKVVLTQKIISLQNDLNNNFAIIQQLRVTNTKLQSAVADEHKIYQKQYELWREQSLNHAKQLNDLRSQYQRQFDKKRQKLLLQFQKITKQRQLQLQKYHKNLVDVQNQLNQQIYILKQQLKNKTLDNSACQEILIQAQHEKKPIIKQQINIHFQNIIHQNQILQTEIGNLKNKGRQLQKQIQNLQNVLQHSKLQQRTLHHKMTSLQSELKMYKSQVETLKNSPRINQLQQQSSVLKKMINSLQLQLKKMKLLFEEGGGKNLERSQFKTIQIEHQIGIQKQKSMGLQRQIKQYQLQLQRIQIQLQNKKFNQNAMLAELKNLRQTKKNTQIQLKTVKNDKNLLQQEVRTYKSSHQSFLNSNLRIQQLLQEINKNKQTINTLQGQIKILKQSEQAFIDSNKKINLMKQQSQKLNNQISELKKQISNLNMQIQQYNRLKSTHQRIQKQKKQLQAKNSQLIKNNLELSNQTLKILQLQDELKKVRAQHQQILNREVNFALKNQQEDFNRFLGQHEKKIEQHFFNIVIPDKIREALQVSRSKDPQGNAATAMQIHLNQEINRLKDINNRLQDQLNNQIRRCQQIDQRYENQLRITQDLERKLNEQLRTMKNLNLDLEDRLRNTYNLQQKVKRYLTSLQITWEQATTGIINQRVNKLYLQPAVIHQTQTIQVIKQVVKQVVKPDPNQQLMIRQLRQKLQNQSRVITQLEKNHEIDTEAMNNLQRLLQKQTKICRQIQLKYNNQINERNKLGELSNNATATDLKIAQQDLRRTQMHLQEANRRYNQEIQVNRDLRKQLSQITGSQQALKLQLRRVQSLWQTRIREQATRYQRKINQLIQKPQTSQAPLVSAQQIKNYQSKIQQLNYKYNEQATKRIQFEHKYNKNVSSYESRVQDIENKALIERTRLENQINLLKERSNQLQIRIGEKDRSMKNLQQSLRKQIKIKEDNIVAKYEEKIALYQNRIAQLMAEVSSIKITSITSSNHAQCQKRFRQLEQRSFRQVTELKIKINQSTHSNRQVDLLKEVINNQKIQLKQLEVMANSFKQSKQEAQMQKQVYFNQLRNLSLQKDKQLSKIRHQYDQKLTALTIQKNSLQSKLKDQSLISQQKSENGSKIKIIELQSMINNTNSQITHLEDIIQRKRKQLQEQHQRLINSERDRENLRMNCNSMQSHIMRLQADISYFSNQLEKYKTLVFELQNRQISLRNDLIKAKTQSDVQNNSILKQQINSLKQQIIRITTTNMQQIHNMANIESFDNSRIKKMMNQIDVQRNSQKYGYNDLSYEALNKISQEVTQLVATNRHLQTKCVLLEAQLETAGKYAENANFLLLLEEKVQQLINFLVEKMLINNTDNYSKFMFNSKQSLKLQDMQGYFNNWLNFMKSLFLICNDLRSEQFRQKSQQIIQLKQQMNQIIVKHIQFTEDVSYQTLDKYKMIFSDIKILLKEFMKSRNEEYIQMIWRSLEPGDQQ